MHGYTLDNPGHLYQQIMDGSDFSQMQFLALTPYGIQVIVPTLIESKRERKKISIYTIWMYKENGGMHFITVDLKKRKNNNDKD